jgi:rhodanese-related sulfurtransferase
MNVLTLLLIGVAVFFVVRLLISARPGITTAEAQKNIQAGTAVLVDVREPSEWSSGVAKPAALLAMSDLRGSRAQWKPFLEKSSGKQIIVYCASGARSGTVAALLRREGHNAVNLGGFSAWANAGLPTRRPN